MLPKDMLLMTLTMPRPPRSRIDQRIDNYQATGDARRVHGFAHEHEHHGRQSRKRTTKSGKHLPKNGEAVQGARKKIEAGGHPEGIGNGKTELPAEPVMHGRSAMSSTSREPVPESCLLRHISL